MKFIKIRGARVHNLKDVNIDIPHGKLVVITGLSGSGKTSLAYDTVFAEGQRRYIEGLSTFTRQFLSILEKPDCDLIEGLSPAIAIDQKSIGKNPRSTVGTITETYDYFRLLYSKAGDPHCPNCQKEMTHSTRTQVIKDIEYLVRSNLKAKMQIFAPIAIYPSANNKKLINHLKKTGYAKARVNGSLIDISNINNNQKIKTLEILIDQFVNEKKIDRNRIIQSITNALDLGDKNIIINLSKGKGKNKNILFTEYFTCGRCGFRLEDLEPRIFSFNNPRGACEYCHGLGYKKEISPKQLVPNPNLTIAEGGIRLWTQICSHMNLYNQLLESIANKSGKTLINTPIKKLKESDLNLVFYGDKSDSKNENFEGIVPYLLKKYYSTNSSYIRSEIEKYMVEKQCSECQGARLRPESLAVKIDGRSIAEICQMTIDELVEYLPTLAPKASKNKRKIIKPIIAEILKILKSLQKVSLGYLSLSRTAGTLSGGESQRIRLAVATSAGLTGVIYVLDEPTVGLHPKDVSKLIDILKDLRDAGNSVLVVEHDKEVILNADYLVDFGPGAGDEGGKITAQGPIEKVLRDKKSITAQYLCGSNKIEKPAVYRKASRGNIEIIEAQKHNLKKVNIKIPIGVFIGVSGVSGSGKSSLVTDILAKGIKELFKNENYKSSDFKKIIGFNLIDKIINIDQSPIGRSPRSNPATFIGFFTRIRELFAKTPESRLRGYNAGSFSFNVKGGRCETCQGDGQIKVEMRFLPDIYVACQDCQGKRYNKEILEIQYKSQNINDILSLTVAESLKYFHNDSAIAEKLSVLNDVGLGYLRLGQPATELSGGEAQRIKLASELSHRSTGNTLYILDEPTTGLHFEDIKKLLVVLNRLVDAGNTVLIIEHNLDVLKSCDWIIDLGPEGGEAGGYLIASGTPEKVASIKKSYTGQYLRKVL